jgi:hypothetical protein
MKATYKSKCPECEQLIHIGDAIESAVLPAGQLVYKHVTCPPEIPHGPVCANCHIERALDGSCECAP